MLDANSDSLLRFAAKEGKDETVKFLIEKKVDVSKVGDCRETALHGAADNGHTLIVEYLLNAGADIDKADIDGETALHGAARHGHMTTVRFLLEKGADINKVDIDKLTVLHHAVCEGYTEIAALFLEKGIDVNKVDIFGLTALHLAALNGDTETARLLIEKGAEIDKADPNGKTALHRAVFYRRTEMVKLLLEKGADIDKAGELGRTALHLAAFNGLNEITALLIKKGADIEKTDSSGKTAQQLAILNEYQEVAKLFISKPFSKEQKIQRLIDAIQILVVTQNEVKHLQQEVKSKQKCLDKAILKELQKKRHVVEHEKASINRQKAYDELEHDKYKLFLAEMKAKELHAVVFQKTPVETQKTISRVEDQSNLDKDKSLIVAKEVVSYLKENAIDEINLLLSMATMNSWRALQNVRKAKSNEQRAFDKQREAYKTYHQKISELRCAPSNRHAENLLETLRADEEKAVAVIYEMRDKRVTAEKLASAAASKIARLNKKLESYKEKLYLAMKVEERLCEPVKPKSIWNIRRKRLADSEGTTWFSKRANKFEVAPGAIEIPFMPSMEVALRSH